MHWAKHLYLQALGVGELLENAVTVAEDWLGRKRKPEASLEGKTAIVTGGNAGVGYATAEALLQHGCHVVLACRDRGRGDAAASRLAAPGRVQVELLDLASLASVKAFVGRWRASGRPLDLLICNAGIMCPPERLETGDGFELQFQSNYLSHFALVNGLARHRQRQRRLPAGGGRAAAADAAAGAERPLRVLMLSSMTHFGGDLSDLSDVPYCRRPPWHSFQAYCNSKLCTLLAAKQLDRLLAQDAQRRGARPTSRDAAVAVHPGLVDTALARGYFKQTAPRLLRPLTDPFFDRLFCPYLLRSPKAAAETVLYAATAPAGEVGGRYCGTAPRVTRHSAAADDPALAQRLWELSVHLCQLEGDELVS